MRRVVLAVLVVTGCAAPESLEPVPSVLPVGAVEYRDALAELDAGIAGALRRAEQNPGSWMPLDAAASRYLERARFTGSLDDYADAEALLDDAFEAGPGGPYLSRAALNFSLHRFDAVGADLDAVDNRVFVDDPTQAAVLGLRGDVQLQRGELDASEALLNAAEALHPDVAGASRLAHHARVRGAFDDADALYLAADGRYHGTSAEVRAWVDLQRGILDLEQVAYDDALTHFLDANADLSGYFLIEEHIAEVYALTDRPGEALALYLDVIERTGNPEFMDAVASLHREFGDAADAEPYIAAADAAYREQLEQFPEAAYGHAVAHYLEFGPGEFALELALLNHGARPNGEAMALVATAYIGLGDEVAARPWIEAAAASGWESGQIDALVERCLRN